MIEHDIDIVMACPPTIHSMTNRDLIESPCSDSLDSDKVLAKLEAQGADELFTELLRAAVARGQQRTATKRQLICSSSLE